jgi:hypothetical protein
MQIIGKNSGTVYTLVQRPDGAIGQPYWTYTYEGEYNGRAITYWPTHCYLSEQHETSEIAAAVCQERDPAHQTPADAPVAEPASAPAVVRETDLSFRHLHPGKQQRCACCGEVSGRFTTMPASANTCDDCA